MAAGFVGKQGRAETAKQFIVDAALNNRMYSTQLKGPEREIDARPLTPVVHANGHIFFHPDQGRIEIQRTGIELGEHRILSLRTKGHARQNDAYGNRCFHQCTRVITPRFSNALPSLSYALSRYG